MCFTPLVSFSIGAIELLLAVLILALFKKTPLRNFSAVLILFLGLYQFTEFQLCTTSNPLFWAKMGFIAYTILPAIEIHALLRIYRKQAPLFAVYAIPVSAALLAILHPQFIIEAACELPFVSISTIFAQWEGFASITLFYGYVAYYFGFIAWAFLLIISHYRKETNHLKKQMDLALAFGLALMLLPTMIFTTILPALRLKFPSVLCSFALFVALTFFIAAYMEHKSIKEKR